MKISIRFIHNVLSHFMSVISNITINSIIILFIQYIIVNLKHFCFLLSPDISNLSNCIIFMWNWWNFLKSCCFQQETTAWLWFRGYVMNVLSETMFVMGYQRRSTWFDMTQHFKLFRLELIILFRLLFLLERR